MIRIFSDGGARGNPGEAAIGILIFLGEEKPEEYKEKIGIATNNIAEYRAIIKALELAAKYKEKEIECFLDSELVVKQLRGEYAVRNEKLIPLFLTVKEIEKKFEKISYTHVKRENEFIQQADKLVNMALDE